MEVNLICSDNLKKLLEEMLSNRRIRINTQSNICIIEKGFNLESGKVGIYFDMQSLDVLIEYLDMMANRHVKQQNIFAGKSDAGEYTILTYDEILYFEALGKDVFCVTQDNRYIVRKKLYDLEIILRKNGFIRVSKSFVVNIKWIDRIIPWFNSTLILKIEGIKVEIVVTRNYINGFKKFLDL